VDLNIIYGVIISSHGEKVELLWRIAILLLD